MNRCLACSYWDSDREGCITLEPEMRYACPCEYEKPENKKELEKMAEWYDEKGEQK